MSAYHTSTVDGPLPLRRSCKLQPQVLEYLGESRVEYRIPSIFRNVGLSEAHRDLHLMQQTIYGWSHHVHAIARVTALEMMNTELIRVLYGFIFLRQQSSEERDVERFVKETVTSLSAVAFGHRPPLAVDSEGIVTGVGVETFQEYIYRAYAFVGARVPESGNRARLYFAIGAFERAVRTVLFSDGLWAVEPASKGLCPRWLGVCFDTVQVAALASLATHLPATVPFFANLDDLARYDRERGTDHYRIAAAARRRGIEHWYRRVVCRVPVNFIPNLVLE